MFKGPLKKHMKKEQDIENFKAFHTASYIFPTMMKFSGEMTLVQCLAMSAIASL